MRPELFAISSKYYQIHNPTGITMTVDLITPSPENIYLKNAPRGFTVTDIMIKRALKSPRPYARVGERVMLRRNGVCMFGDIISVGSMGEYWIQAIDDDLYVYTVCSRHGFVRLEALENR